jgi:4'-phosphopantetheinyl transferase EntD
VDAEPWRPLRDGVLDTVSLPVERARLAVLEESHAGLASWDRLLFCVKEAVYKAWYPRTRTELGFRDVAVTFDPARHAFRAVVLAHGGGEFTGRWLAREGVLVAVALGGGG